MSVFQLKSLIRIACAKHCAPYLEQEVKALGYTPVAVSDTGIDINGNLQDCMHLNLYLRTAYRVLFQVDNFEAPNPDALYENLRELPWEEYIPANGYISISSFADNIYIRDTRFANLRVKDAVVDRLQDKMGKRPDSGPETDRTVLFLYWKNNEASIFLDTSGETIAKHNYRKMPHKAPMQEALAASVILATGWDKKSDFINPMCGSGTLAIEAALMAINKAPGLMRRNFGFMHILGFDEKQWTELRNEAKSKIDRNIHINIIATDRDFRAMNAAETNAQIAGVSEHITFQTATFEHTKLPGRGGIIIMNPPYGERMGETDELSELYAHIGYWLKRSASGYRAFVFTGNADMAKRIGLKTSRKIPFYNAKIESRLLEYELYEGSRKHSSAQAE